MLSELLFGPDSGEHEDLGRIYGSGGNDHLFARSKVEFPPESLDFDSVGRIALQQHFVGGGERQHSDRG